MRIIGPLLIPIVLLALAAAAVLPTPVQTESRIRQHLFSLGIQLLAAAVAAVLLRPSGAASESEDPERAVWQRLSLSSLLWALGLLLYGLNEWIGLGPAYPSPVDIVFVVSSVILGVGLLKEFRLVRPLLTVWMGLLMTGLAIGMSAGGIAALQRSVMMTPTDLMERIVDLAYPTIGLLQVSLVVGPVLALRGSLSGNIWIGAALGVACLALSMIGFVYLASFDLYSDTHPINLLRIAGFAFLAGSGAWRRQVITAIVAEGALARRRELRASDRRWVRSGKGWALGGAARSEIRPPAPEGPPRQILRPRPAPTTRTEARAALDQGRRRRPWSVAAGFSLVFIFGAAVGGGTGWVIYHRANDQAPPLRGDGLSQGAIGRQPITSPSPQTSSAPLTPPGGGQWTEQMPAAPVQLTGPQPAPTVAPVTSDQPAAQAFPQLDSSLPVAHVDVQERYRAANQLMSEGRFREAQDEYLGILLALTSSNDEVAMKGLIMARRRLAGDNPAVLRRQAAAYLKAVAGGVETAEHYSRRAMEVLARASLAAAREVEGERLRKP